MSRDPYEPLRMDEAWQAYREEDYRRNSPDSYQAFRAGYRHGFTMGALVDAGMVVHTSEPHVTEEER